MSDRSALPLEGADRVLVVGDTERTAAVVSALSGAIPDASLTLAPSAVAALERLEREDVRCVVCGVAGDGGTSLSTVETVADAGARPIVAVVDRDRAAAALDAGASDVVYPDESPEAVAARIETAVDRARLRGADDGRYRSILEGSGAPVLVLDADGSVRDATPAVADESGYAPTALANTDCVRLVHPDDRPTVRETVAALVDDGLGSTATRTVRVRRADGSWRVRDLRFANRLDDPRVSGLVVTVTRASPSAVRMAVDPDPYEHVEYPLLALGPEWAVAAANEAAGRLLGRSVDDLEGTILWDLLPGDARDAFVDRCHEARRTDSTVEFEVPFAPRETTLSVHVHPAGSGVILYAREDDDARPGRDRERLLEAVVDALEDAVLVLDGRSIDHANAAAVGLVDEPSLVGRDLEALFDPPAADRILERARSTVVRRTDPIETSLGRDDSRPVAVTVAPLPGDDRAVCVARDDARRVRTRSAIETVGDAAREFREDASDRRIYERLAGAARDVSGGTAALVYRTDGTDFRPAAVATDAATPLESLPALPRDDAVLDRYLDGTTTLAAAPADASASTSLSALRSRLGIRAERLLAAPIGDGGVLLVTDPTDADPLVPVVDALASAAGLALDRLDREEALGKRERTLERTRDRLDRLEELLECQRRIERAISAAETRSDLERAVCEELLALEGVSLAWIGDAVGATDRVSPRAAAGESAYLDAGALDPGDDPSIEDAEPARRTAASGSVTVVDRIDEAGRSAPWRWAALERGFESALSVPIGDDGYRYGTLSVYAIRPSRFDEAAQETLAALGETVAFAIGAIETRRALVTDGVTRLEFGVADAEDALLAVARRVGSRLHVESVVPRSDGRTTVFATVSETDADRFAQLASDVDGVESVRSLADRDGARVEFVAETRLVSVLADHGGVLRSVDGGADRTRFVVDLPRGADVRAFVDVLDRTVPSVELRARRETDRPVRTRRDLPSALEDRLTDRQWRALEAAYYGGFFEWPRERTGEEVADSIDVSQPTFNRHFRAAERKLFTMLFEGE